jgi:hypothetical protein
MLPNVTGDDWLGRFCHDLGDLRELTVTAPASEKLEQLAREATAGPIDAAWTARFVQLLRDLGIPATTAERAWQPQVGGVGDLLRTGNATPSVDFYRCPRSVCTRQELRVPGGAEPRCLLHGGRLALLDPS